MDELRQQTVKSDLIYNSKCLRKLFPGQIENDLVHAKWIVPTVQYSNTWDGKILI